MQVRAAHPDDIPRLLPFLAEVFPEAPLKSREDYFRWRFCENPHAADGQHYWIAEQEGQIIGQLAGWPDRLRAGGHWQRCCWLVDLIVAEQHRGGLAALRLFQQAMRMQKLLLTSGAGEHLTALYEQLGFARLNPQASMYLPIRPSCLLRMAGRSSTSQQRSRWQHFAARAADYIAPPLQRIRRRMAYPHRRAAFPIAPDEERISRLIDREVEQLGITNDRSQEVLRWKYLSPPVGRRLCLGCRTGGEAGSGLDGYAAAKYFRRGDVARWLEVVDYVVADERHLAALGALTAAVVEAALPLDFVRFRLSNPVHRDWLRARGWIDRTRPVVDDLFAYSSDTDLLEDLSRERWHLTSLAGDRADYGRDEWEADG